MMKKFLVSLLILVLIFSVVGCKGSNNTAKSTTDSVKDTGNTNSNNNNTENGNAGSKEPVKLRIVMKDADPSDPVAVKFFENLEKALAEEGFNYKFELVQMPAGNYAEKLNLMLLSGNVPDIIYFQGGDKQIADQGLLENLLPYVENSKYIKRILYPHNIKRLQNYPYLLWIKPVSSKVPVVRSDWFEKMESSKQLMDNPTIDNYYTFLRELKEKDFDGKGNPVYGVTVAGNIIELDEVFDQAFGNTATWIKDNSGKYIYKRVSQNEKEKLAFYRKLYEEKILDPEYLTKQWDTKEQAFYSNTVGMIIGTAGKVIDIYEGKMKKANGDNVSLVVLPPAKGKAQGYLPIDVNKETRGFAISALSKYKNEAFQVFEFLATPKGQLLDRLGFENEHYIIKDNKIYLTEKSQEWFSRFWEPLELNVGMEVATPLLSKPAEESLNLANKYYTEDVNFLIPADFTAKWDAMENLYKEFSADIITGKRSIDDFDAFVQEWYKAGGNEVTQYANEVLK
ncbi:putative aldouronate transport system substrate-binding protein [Caldicoprobacter guelmensis]|uniref:extracellular solute-binding protein n=1 Tax=Caldicoprobacter guelmensis TaxID=1170224 RepID=UPI00195CDB80|nr:extracellular solute-binding protein [Caldicoprobacter guelmensis]MBM7582961.1 putative aldouronate transport system substrate-binding protein [Caldicoprobacter guelmensis]